ncbi:MAG: nucleoside deaminase [Planctomycetes bacterium]|nr:nucleoside deaminase [Planctomycetota bacterium]
MAVLPETVAPLAQRGLAPSADAAVGGEAVREPVLDAHAGTERDQRFMRIALDEARAAERLDEVPIGAVVVIGERVIAAAHNLTRTHTDPTNHAELLALSRAARTLGAARLVDAEVFTTVEPCFMCAGALLHARVKRVVWAVRDPKFGGCASLGHVLSDPRANHRAELAELSGSACADAARELLQSFFRKKRGSPSSS